MNKFLKKHFSNIIFIIIIGLLLYTPTRVYFIRLISFAPTAITVDKQVTIEYNNWNLKGLNTEDYNFLSSENQVLFISFWATWCPPCIAELPSMQNLYNDYKDKVRFIFITNEDWQTVSQFYKDKEYNLPTYTNLTNPPLELTSNTIPATFIIAKNKIVVDKKGPANWNSKKIRELLDQLFTQN